MLKGLCGLCLALSGMRSVAGPPVNSAAAFPENLRRIAGVNEKGGAPQGPRGAKKSLLHVALAQSHAWPVTQGIARVLAARWNSGSEHQFESLAGQALTWAPADHASATAWNSKAFCLAIRTCPPVARQAFRIGDSSQRSSGSIGQGCATHLEFKWRGLWRGWRFDDACNADVYTWYPSLGLGIRTTRTRCDEKVTTPCASAIFFKDIAMLLCR